jgi:hypothetical protein
LQCSNVGKRRPESRKQGAANRLLLAAEMVLKELVSRNIPGIHAGNCAVHKYTKSQSGVQNRTNGGESVSQSPLKDKAFSTFQDQNPPFELPPKKWDFVSGKSLSVQWPAVDNSAIKRLAKGKLPSHRDIFEIPCACSRRAFELSQGCGRRDGPWRHSDPGSR